MNTPAKAALLILALALTGCLPVKKKTTEAAKKQEPETVATAAYVIQVERQNQIAFREKYLNKPTRIVGVVGSVKQVGKQAHVELDAGDGKVVLKTKDLDKAGSLTRGTIILADGTGDGSVLGTPLFRDCTILGSGFKSVDEAMKAGE
jgi:hypothetical protein